MSLALQADVPRGFKVAKSNHNMTVVEYRSTGMSAILIFAVICLTGLLTAVIRTPINEFVSMSREITSIPMAIAVAACVVMGIVAWVYLAWFLIFHLFGKIVFTLSADGLELSLRLFLFKRDQYFNNTDIQCVRRIKDGGEGDDSFPSFAVELVLREKVAWFTHKTINLLSRQPQQQCDWLGNHIATHLQIKYHVT